MESNLSTSVSGLPTTSSVESSLSTMSSAETTESTLATTSSTNESRPLTTSLVSNLESGVGPPAEGGLSTTSLVECGLSTVSSTGSSLSMTQMRGPSEDNPYASGSIAIPGLGSSAHDSEPLHSSTNESMAPTASYSRPRLHPHQCVLHVLLVPMQEPLVQS